MRCEPDGRRFVLHRALVEWVELLEECGEHVRVVHPLTREPTLLARALFDCESASLDQYFRHVRDASFDAPIDSETDIEVIGPGVRVLCPRPPHASEPVPWSPTERILLQQGWVVIYFGPVISAGFRDAASVE